MSFAAVQKHVAVLESAGLVTKRADGRQAAGLRELAAIHRTQELLAEYEQLWRARVDRPTTCSPKNERSQENDYARHNRDH